MTKNNGRSRFVRGSGCYECRCCSKKTRSTGRGDNENCGLCADCFDLAGEENVFGDNPKDSDEAKGALIIASTIFKRRPDLMPHFPTLVVAMVANANPS